MPCRFQKHKTKTFIDCEEAWLRFSFSKCSPDTVSSLWPLSLASLTLCFPLILLSLPAPSYPRGKGIWVFEWEKEITKTKCYTWFLISTNNCNWLVPEHGTISFLCPPQAHHVPRPHSSCVFLISTPELVTEDFLTESRLIPKAISKFTLIALGGEPGDWVDHGTWGKRLCIVECCTLGLDYVQEAETGQSTAISAWTGESPDCPHPGFWLTRGVSGHLKAATRFEKYKTQPNHGPQCISRI